MARLGQILLIATSILLVAGLASNSYAGRKAERLGKRDYKKFCRTCHDGSYTSPDGKKASKLQPNSLASKQWEDKINNKYKSEHEKLTDPKHDNKKVLDLVSDKSLKNILEFLRTHGADSDQPATCG